MSRRSVYVVVLVSFVIFVAIAVWQWWEFAFGLFSIVLLLGGIMNMYWGFNDILDVCNGIRQYDSDTGEYRIKPPATVTVKGGAIRIMVGAFLALAEYSFVILVEIL